MTFNLVPLKSSPPPADLMSSGLSEVYSRQRKSGPPDNIKGTVLPEGVPYEVDSGFVFNEHAVDF